MQHAGVDYGAKYAGTTAICFIQNDELVVLQSEKKQNADSFISDMSTQHKLKQLFIDAPLSLPAAYYGLGDDFQFRQADKEVKCMSPMFLGGLTARAMKLKYELNKKGITLLESYPRVAAENYLGEYYKFYKTSKKEAFYEGLKSILPLPIKNKPENWHIIDAALAWFIGYKYQSETHTTYGNENEGLILA